MYLADGRPNPQSGVLGPFSRGQLLILLNQHEPQDTRAMNFTYFAFPTYINELFKIQHTRYRYKLRAATF